MDETLHALGGLLLRSVPTIAFFIFLAVYLDRIFFRPVARILEERRRQTEGVRELAQRAFEAAEKKGSEFEQALHAARNEIYAENEALRRQWEQEQQHALAAARAEADRQIEQARRDIEQEIERGEAEIQASIDRLSDTMVDSLLRRRAA